MQAIFRKTGKTVDHTPSSAIAAGTVTLIGPLVGVAERDIAANELGALTIEGVFDVVMAAVTITAGDEMYWDADGNPVGGEAGTGAATNVSTGNTFMGFCPGAHAATESTARIVLLSADASALSAQTLSALGDVGATAYTAGKILVADGNSYEEVAVGGDGTLSAAGVLAITSLAAMPTFPVAAKVATGSTQAHALAAPTAVLAAGFNHVTAADATKGVAMPVAAAGKVVIIKNADVANAVLKVWPNTDDAINALAANASLDMAAKTSAILIALDATTWYTIPLLPS